MSAARKPAPATMIVCGAPFGTGAFARSAGFSENSSRKVGRFSRFLVLEKDEVSLIEFSTTAILISARAYDVIPPKIDRLTRDIEVR